MTWKPKWEVQHSSKAPLLKPPADLRSPNTFLYASQDSAFLYFPSFQKVLLYDLISSPEPLGLSDVSGFPTNGTIYVPSERYHPSSLYYYANSITEKDQPLLYKWTENTFKITTELLPNPNALPNEEIITALAVSEVLGFLFTGHPTGVIKVWVLRNSKWYLAVSRFSYFLPSR